MFETFEKTCPSSVACAIDAYIEDLDKANKKIQELYHFIEMTEALTYDKATGVRIRTFLTEEGVWNVNTISKSKIEIND
jgi:hypothetical protein